jgi:hypothetical protein
VLRSVGGVCNRFFCWQWGILITQLQQFYESFTIMKVPFLHVLFFAIQAPLDKMDMAYTFT